MPNQSNEPPLFVSLQSGPREPGAGVHIAAGALLGSDLAIFALPRHVDLCADVRLHVLISPRAAGPADVIERILPQHMVISSSESDPQDRVVVILLANRSRYAAAAADPQALTTRVAPFLDGPSLPHVLRAAGLLPSEHGGCSVESVLTAILQVETAQTRKMISFRLGRVAEEAAHGLFGPHAPGWPVVGNPWDGLALAPG